MSQNPPLSQGDLTKLLWIRTFCTKTYFLLLLCCSLPLMNSIPLVLTKSYVICSLLISSKHDLTGTSNPVVMVLYHCFRKFHLALQRRNGKSNMLSKFNYLKRGLSIHLCIHSIRSLDPPDLNKYLLYFLPSVCYITLMMLANSEQQQ